MKITHNNNFDAIRLLAAIEVTVHHTFRHLEVGGWISSVIKFTNYFPGVLLFFVISGFLISSSWERNNDIRRYFTNRCLRIFPALWVCFAVTVILLLSFKILDINSLYSKDILLWSFTQTTVFQFWTPDILRDWGVGCPNGSLWTIPIELQFYALLPIILILSNKIKKNILFIIIILVSIGANLVLSDYVQDYGESVFTKLFGISVFPYLYCFIIGVVLNKNWDHVKKYVEGKFLYWVIGYMIFNIIFKTGPSYYPNDIMCYISNFLLSITTISLAFSATKISTILNKNDISYGIYIYHMLVVNTFITLGLTGKISYLFLVLLITIMLATFSWVFIEKKALNYKSNI